MQQYSIVFIYFLTIFLENYRKFSFLRSLRRRVTENVFAVRLPALPLSRFVTELVEINCRNKSK